MYFASEYPYNAAIFDNIRTMLETFKSLLNKCDDGLLVNYHRDKLKYYIKKFDEKLKPKWSKKYNILEERGRIARWMGLAVVEMHKNSRKATFRTKCEKFHSDLRFYDRECRYPYMDPLPYESPNVTSSEEEEEEDD